MSTSVKLTKLLSDISHYTVILSMLNKIKMQIVNIMGFVYDSTNHNMTKCKEKMLFTVNICLSHYLNIASFNQVITWHTILRSAGQFVSAPYTRPCLLVFFVCNNFSLNLSSSIYIIISTPVPQSQCLNSRDMCNECKCQGIKS